MATVSRTVLVIFIGVIVYCIFSVSYLAIFDSTLLQNFVGRYTGDQPLAVIIQQDPDTNPSTLSTNTSSSASWTTKHSENLSMTQSESYRLNYHLFNLSSIDRSAIDITEWTNPSVVTPFTIVVGYCCEIANKFNCILPKYVLILSMAIWNDSKYNLYFQRCLQSGFPPNHLREKQITIRDRRDTELNGNNTKQWVVMDGAGIWFQPDMYLCQVYSLSYVLSFLFSCHHDAFILISSQVKI